MKLSAHFTLEELCVTSTGIDNTPEPEHLENLRFLAAKLEEVRQLVARSIHVNSAYRNKAVNKKVGGVPNSDHTNGFAADITVQGMDAKELAKAIVASDIKFDQVILETSRSVVHFSVAPRMRQRALTQPSGPGSPFIAGIV